MAPTAGSPGYFNPMVSSQWTIEKFLNELGSSKPAPGGGSAAAVAGCLGTELGSMVCRILLSRSRLSSKTAVRLKKDLKVLNRLSRQLRRLIQEDANAYLGFVRALASRRGIPAAIERATQSPIKICETTSRGIEVLRSLRVLVGPSLASDLKGGEALLRGAFEAARVTLEMNLKWRSRPQRKS